MQQFGERVAFYRKKCKLSQKELAETINKLGKELPDELPCEITKHRISRIERGIAEPTLPETIAFSLVLNVDLNCLVHNLCNLSKNIMLSDIERICSGMDEEKREEFLKLVEVQAYHVRDNIRCGRGRPSA